MSSRLPSKPVEAVLALLPDARPSGNGYSACCPAHDDSNPSLSISEGDDGQALLHCHAGCDPADVIAAISLEWRDLFPPSTKNRSPRAQRKGIKKQHTDKNQVTPRGADAKKMQAPPFTPEEALAVWEMSLEHARDDDAVEAERVVYNYLSHRRLSEAWCEGLVGILPDSKALPKQVSKWRAQTFRIIAPLYDSTGKIRCVQSRSIASQVKPKTRNPKGSHVSGLLFANDLGLELLRGQHDGKVVVFGEGLTDSLALGIALPHIPVLCAPGVGNAAKCIADWVEGRILLLALDCDEAGHKKVAPVALEAYAHNARAVGRTHWPDNANDACDIVQRHGADALRLFIEQYLEEAAWTFAAVA